jgi:hypothetical protein
MPPWNLTYLRNRISKKFGQNFLSSKTMNRLNCIIVSLSSSRTGDYPDVALRFACLENFIVDWFANPEKINDSSTLIFSENKLLSTLKKSIL